MLAFIRSVVSMGEKNKRDKVAIVEKKMGEIKLGPRRATVLSY